MGSVSSVYIQTLQTPWTPPWPPTLQDVVSDWASSQATIDIKRPDLNIDLFPYDYNLFQHLVLVVKLSILFCTLDAHTWIATQQFIATLNHFNPELSSCRAREFQCWAHCALLSNLEIYAHHNLRDNQYGYTVITFLGSFVGVDFIIPELHLKFSFQPRNIIFIKGQMLQHFIMEWMKKIGKGERFCMTHFTHQALVDLVAKASQQAASSLNNWASFALSIYISLSTFETECNGDSELLSLDELGIIQLCLQR